jgi:hypothetical protein
MLASAAAAALTTLAVTVAVPAIADDSGDPKSEDQVVTCLVERGLDGAPAGAGLKAWLGERLERGDATAKRALHACVPEKRIVNAGPTEQELRSCLSEHGVQLPAGDGRVLKQWILEHGDDAANRDAMKACHMGLVAKPGVGIGGPCGKEDGVITAVPAERAGKPAELPPVSDGN